MKNCYWMVNVNNCDEDKIIYTTDIYEINDIVDGWRVIEREIIK